jgi:hypothetical protein
MSIHDDAGRPGSESVTGPFGTRASASRRAFWFLLGAAGLAALGAAAYLGTRREPKAATTEGHNHAAISTTDSAQPVMLGPDAQHRIGVTFTQVALAPLERQVRTVGQLTYDETRVRRIVPRVDGYIETLVVNYVGQKVSRGDPLFTSTPRCWSPARRPCSWPGSWKPR